MFSFSAVVPAESIASGEYPCPVIGDKVPLAGALLAPPQILSSASKRVTNFKLGDTIKSVPTRSL